MQEALQDIKDEKMGLIRIGVAQGVIPVLDLDMALAAFLSLYPGIRAAKQSQSDAVCETMSLENTLDLAFMMGPISHVALKALLLSSEGIHAAMKRSRPLSDQE